MPAKKPSPEHVAQLVAQHVGARGRGSGQEEDGPQRESAAPPLEVSLGDVVAERLPGDLGARGCCDGHEWPDRERNKIPNAAAGEGRSRPERAAARISFDLSHDFAIVFASAQGTRSLRVP